MLVSEINLTIVAVVYGTLGSSIVLGFILRQYKGRISESSKSVRLCILIVLSIGVGITIFVLLTSPSVILLGFLISFPCGIVLLWEPRR